MPDDSGGSNTKPLEQIYQRHLQDRAKRLAKLGLPDSRYCLFFL
jgi:hypothetical protein